ncbi:MAG: hypothetical protein IT426_18255 [Pirellulales bacterium]|nr:hypothetical protein [Pirellulales bacterium]
MFRKILWCSSIAFVAGLVFLQSSGSNILFAAGDDPFAEKTGNQSPGAKQPAKPPAMSKAEIAEDIERALDEPAHMDFTETALSDVIGYLKDCHQQKHRAFDIQLDTKTLNELGITPDTPMTKYLKGISLRATLRLMLRDLGLTYVIRDEVLLVTSPEEACYTKVYDVADLVAAKEGEKNSPLDSLMEMVAKICPAGAPPSKSGVNGWIASLKSADIAAVVVHQPEECHEEVADLLAQLRAVKKHAK